MQPAARPSGRTCQSWTWWVFNHRSSRIQRRHPSTHEAAFPPPSIPIFPSQISGTQPPPRLHRIIVKTQCGDIEALPDRRYHQARHTALVHAPPPSFTPPVCPLQTQDDSAPVSQRRNLDTAGRQPVSKYNITCSACSAWQGRPPRPSRTSRRPCWCRRKPDDSSRSDRQTGNCRNDSVSRTASLPTDCPQKRYGSWHYRSPPPPSHRLLGITSCMVSKTPCCPTSNASG